jgi:hypothetical protein
VFLWVLVCVWSESKSGSPVDGRGCEETDDVGSADGGSLTGRGGTFTGDAVETALGPTPTTAAGVTETLGLDFADVRLFFGAGAFPPDMAVLRFRVLPTRGVGVFTTDVAAFWRGVGLGNGKYDAPFTGG